MKTKRLRQERQTLSHNVWPLLFYIFCFTVGALRCLDLSKTSLPSAAVSPESCLSILDNRYCRSQTLHPHKPTTNGKKERDEQTSTGPLQRVPESMALSHFAVSLLTRLQLRHRVSALMSHFS